MKVKVENSEFIADVEAEYLKISCSSNAIMLRVMLALARHTG